MHSVGPLIFSTSQAGVSTAAGEEAKDNHYSVSNRIICESFGVWTPYALSTLFSIVDRSTVKSGLP